MFLKNKNIIFKIRRSKVTDYAALNAADMADLSVTEKSVTKMSVTKMSWPKRPKPKCPWPKGPRTTWLICSHHGRRLNGKLGFTVGQH